MAPGRGFGNGEYRGPRGQVPLTEGRGCPPVGFARVVNQLHDGTGSLAGLNIYTPEEKLELNRLWEDFMHHDLYPARIPKFSKIPGPPTRVVPAYELVKNHPELQPWENSLEILKAQDRICIMDCSCRARKIVLGTGCQRSDAFNCFNFNRAVDYALARGNGKELSLQEAIDLTLDSHKRGLVQFIRNAKNIKGVLTSCVCCPDCCIYIEPMYMYGRSQYPIDKWLSRSRFEARIDVEECNGCQLCVEQCPFEAIAMEKVAGQKKLTAAVDPAKCMGCGVCYLACTAGAISMACVRPENHVPEAVPIANWLLNIPGSL